jgi:CRP-like cAMP-binding protein
MFTNTPERKMHWTRWVLTVGWLLIIASLFYDPWTAALTVPDHAWSPLSLMGDCVQVQGVCVEQEPYPIGATLFWGAIVPSGIFILLVFGHELWRRICPLSFLSQIPRGLGWQRQFKRVNEKTGKVRYELAKVPSDSWLGRNYLYVQFAYLFIGLCGRILFFNADRLVLGSWLVFTIVFAIAIGYVYGGKSWCQYFCPMSPVQTVFSEPRGLLGSKAHMSESRITQSMCRTVTPEGTEQSACVACQSPCIDIDSERTYWDGLQRNDEAVMRYGYLGLMVGYFYYYYLYAGNWDYYFSGVWNRDPNQLAALWSPGLYLNGQAIGIPKLFAVPLVLGVFTAAGYLMGKGVERGLKAYNRDKQKNWSNDLIQHRIFAVVTFIAFNFFFIFAARPLILLTHPGFQTIYDIGLVFLSTLWLNKTWRRSPDLYSREKLSSRFRKQLEKLNVDIAQYVEGRSLDDLNANEVYLLAKILPDFTREKRHQAYKGVVREALEEGYVNTSNSLEVLEQMRRELDISDDEHREVLEELGIEDPDLLNPNRKRTLENQIRLTGYQRSLERLMRLQQRADLTAFVPSEDDSATIRSLRREYSITPQEEDWIQSGLSTGGGNVQKVEVLLARLREWVGCDRALYHLTLQQHPAVLEVLRETIERKQELISHSVLDTLASFHDHPSAIALAQSFQQVAPEIAARSVTQNRWQAKLSPEMVQVLSGGNSSTADALLSTEETVDYLEFLMQHFNPLVQASALYLIAQINPERGQAIAQKLLLDSPSVLLQRMAEQLKTLSTNASLTAFPELEKLVYLFNSDFFHGIHTDTLMALGDRAEVRTYSSGDFITEAGDTCRELLLLIEGDANIRYQSGNQIRIEQFHPGQMLDELEVLTHSELENTITAESERTRILAVPVDTFDELLDRDPDFARKVLELESRQLQRVVRL